MLCKSCRQPAKGAKARPTIAMAGRRTSCWCSLRSSIQHAPCHGDHHRASKQTRELFSTRGGGGGAALKRITVTAQLVCSSSHNGLVGAWLHPSNVHPPCPAIIEVNRRSILFLIDYFSPRSSPPLHPSSCSLRRGHPGSCAAGEDTSIYVGTIAAQ